MRSFVLATGAITFLCDDEIIGYLCLLLAYFLLFWLLLNILVFFVVVLLALIIILVHKWMVLLPLWIIDIDVEVLSYVNNVIVLNRLPVMVRLDARVIIIVVIFNVICYVGVLVEWEILLLLLEVAIWCAQVGVAEVHLSADHWRQVAVCHLRVFLFQRFFVFN